MPKNVPAVVESILSSGIDLEEFGSANWAIHWADALQAISKLHELGIPILGGDVWEIRDGRPFLTRDNWFCRRLVDEPLQSFLERSVEVAKNYVRNYGSDLGDRHLFELVIDRAEAMKRG